MTWDLYKDRGLSALEAHHIRAHTDIHCLFDDGYATVVPDLRFVVSPRLQEEFENGRVYYALDGRLLVNFPDPVARISRGASSWNGTAPRCTSDDACAGAGTQRRSSVTRRLRPGVYEDMITAALEAEIDARREDGWRVDVHFGRRYSPPRVPGPPRLRAPCVARWKRFRGDDDAQTAAQVALANRLV